MRYMPHSLRRHAKPRLDVRLHRSRLLYRVRDRGPKNVLSRSVKNPRPQRARQLRIFNLAENDWRPAQMPLCHYAHIHHVFNGPRAVGFFSADHWRQRVAWVPYTEIHDAWREDSRSCWKRLGLYGTLGSSRLIYINDTKSGPRLIWFLIPMDSLTTN